MNVKEEVDKIELKDKIVKIINGNIPLIKDAIIEFMKENLAFDYAKEKKNTQNFQAG